LLSERFEGAVTRSVARVPDAAITRAIAAMDYTRRSPPSVGGRAQHKEWQHFVILAPDIDLLVNFSCCDEIRRGANPRTEQPRLVFLARTNAWDGDVEQFASEDVSIAGGRIFFRLDQNHLEFRDGVFSISAALRTRPIAIEAELRPLTLPVFVPSTPMLEGPPLHWLVVPRLEVHGVLTVAGRPFVLDGAPAYHDHNWGHFLWGHDLSWEWGFVLPDDAAVPWCLTFVRLTDRARTTALEHKLLLWRGAHLCRSFREGEVHAETSVSPLRLRRVFKAPRTMALVAPETATDVPQDYEMRAAVGDDWLTCQCAPYDAVQVLIPSETDLGVTIFNEVSARSVVRGQIGGEDVSFAGRSILEFIRHV
jgi:hypothetical protein